MEVKLATETFKTPFIVKNHLNKWPIFNFTESQWCKVFLGKELKFRNGCHGYKKNPRWEGTCEEVTMALDTFFEKSKNASDEWLYYDYKDMSDIFGENGDIIEAVRWCDLGFPELSGKESTLWIGNAGAHTPCHMDSYGYNLVAQLYGRKMWILIAPEETSKMRPSRVPYEESSVYSEYDFFSPNAEVLTLNNIYKVILEPGDVLYVPRHWWHYVENAEVAISVNTWIPSDEDDGSRLEEALVQRFVWTVCQDLTEKEAQRILNPNEISMVTTPLNDELLQAVATRCLEKQIKNLEKREQLAETEPKSPNDDIRPLSPVTREEMQRYVSEKAEKYAYDPKGQEKTTALDRVEISKLIINSFCHPDTICLAKQNFIEQLKRDHNK